MAYLAGWYFARPPHHGGFAYATIVNAAFSGPQGERATDCGPVVAGEHDQGIVTNAEVLDRFEDLTDRPVHFLYRVPDQLPGSAFEFLGDRQRQVHHGVREVKKEGVILVFGNEFDRFLGVALGQGLLVRRILDYLFAPHQGNPIPFLVSRLYFLLASGLRAP